jgi:hypothetical protein
MHLTWWSSARDSMSSDGFDPSGCGGRVDSGSLCENAHRGNWWLYISPERVTSLVGKVEGKVPEILPWQINRLVPQFLLLACVREMRH